MKPETTTRERQWLMQVSAIVVFTLAAMILISPSATAQQAPAGAVIGNQASATYTDNTATVRTSTSNTVQTTVAQVYTATLNQAGAKTAPPNQQVCYPHSITNTGNGVDVFALNTPSLSANNPTPGTFAHTSVNYYLDANQDGVPDNNVVLTSSGNVAAGATYSFVVCGITPTGRTNGDTGTIQVNVASNGGGTVTPSSQTNTTTIGLAAIAVSKQLCTITSVAPSCTPVSSGAAGTGPYLVILNYTNSGGTAADFVKLKDELPTGWTYVTGDLATWSGTGTALTDAAGGDPTGVTDYTYTANAPAMGRGTVDVNITQVAGSTSGFITFQVNIAPGLPIGSSANTTNTAVYTYSYQNGTNTTCVNGSVTTTQAGGGNTCPLSTPASTNSVVYTVIQSAVVATNGSSTLSGDAASDPVTQFATSPGGVIGPSSAAPGQTIYFTDYIWNKGNGADTFDVSLRNAAGSTIPLNGSSCAVANTTAGDCSFPASTTFQILQSSGAATLQDSNSNGIPDTGSIPVPTKVTAGNTTWTCPSPYIVSRNGTFVSSADAQTVVTSTPNTPEYCGLPIVIAATLPTGAASPAGTNGGNNFKVTVRATSAFNSAVSESAVNQLTTILGNYVDLTNDNSTTGTVVQPGGESVNTETTPLVGMAASSSAADGVGATMTTVIRTNIRTPSTSAVTRSYFKLVVNNTGAGAGTYGLAANYASTTLASSGNAVGPAYFNGGFVNLPPHSWTVAFKSFTGSGSTDCGAATVGATITATNSIAPKGNQVVCVEVTIPATTTLAGSPGTAGTTAAAIGDYDFDFFATLQSDSNVNDRIRDRVTLEEVRSVTLTPNGSQSTVPGGAVTYTHTITNNGNFSEPISFGSSFLANNQTPTYSWNTTAFVDTNGNGIYDGPDTAIVAGGASPFTLAPNQTRTIFVRVSAPASAGSPPNTTTITATYNTSATTVATDLTTLTAGLLLDKYQWLTACNAAPSGALTGSTPTTIGNGRTGWTKNAITPDTDTRPGRCIAYLIVATNTTGNNITNASISDAIPSNTKYEQGCTPNAGGTVNDISGSSSYPTPSVYMTGFSGTLTVAATPSSTILAPTGTISMQFCVKIN